MFKFKGLEEALALYFRLYRGYLKRNCCVLLGALELWVFVASFVFKAKY